MGEVDARESGFIAALGARAILLSAIRGPEWMDWHLSRQATKLERHRGDSSRWIRARRTKAPLDTVSKTKLRLAVPEDAAAIAAIYAPVVSETATSFEVVPPDAAEMAQRISKISERYPWIVADDNGAVLGYAYGSTHRARYAYQWSAEVSAYVHADHHRKGVGRALYESLFEILALQGYRSAFAGLTLPNQASEEFHKSLGFSVIGVFHNIGYKNNEWHDTLWLERQLAPYDVDIPSPRAMTEVLSDPAFQSALASGEKFL